MVPWYLVDAVVHAPLGSHPGEMPFYYWRDEEHLASYIEATKNEGTTQEYLQKWIWDVSDHQEYLTLVGHERIEYVRNLAKNR